VLARLNLFSRIPLCGLNSQYNEAQPRGIRKVDSLLVNRTRLQGFGVWDHLDRWPAALEELTGCVAKGKLKYRDTITSWRGTPVGLDASG
jgi:NADPH-dependent curcumin reductase